MTSAAAAPCPDCLRAAVSCVRHRSASDVARCAYAEIILRSGRNWTPGGTGRATGAVGECWTNAQALCRAEPARFGYAEGLVRRSARHQWELHGYAVDLTSGRVAETTAGYADSVAYRGWRLDLGRADDLYAEHGEDAPLRPSVLWLLLLDAIEDAGAPYRWPPRFRWPRRLVIRG